MAETRVLLASLSDQPIYNIKAVCKRTGLSMATLRAWERRYGMPLPGRTEGGYRLYSERDIAMLFWLMQQVELGINIGQAAHQLYMLLETHSEITVHIPPIVSDSAGNWPDYPLDRRRSPGDIAEDLLAALTAVNDHAAQALLGEALALFKPETVLIDVLQTVLHTLRQQFIAHEITVTTLNSALNAAHRRLVSMLQMTPVSHQQRSIFVIGFSNEHSETDILILCLLVRKYGWRISYLGNDIEPPLLAPMVAAPNIQMLIFYTDEPANAERLAHLELPTRQTQDADGSGNPSRTILTAFCGQAVALDPDLAHRLPDWISLGGDMRTIVRNLNKHLTAQR